MYEKIRKELCKSSTDIDWNYIEYDIEKVSDINESDDSGENLLILFLRKENTPISLISKIINLGIDINRTNIRYGRNGAFYTRDTKILKLLIEKGLNINYQDESKWTFAHYNIDDYEIFNFAVNNGLDLTLKGFFKRNILFTIIEEIRDNDFEKYLKLLIDKGLNIDEQDEFGFTPIHYSIITSNSFALEYLKKNGAKTDIALTKNYKWDIDENEEIELLKGFSVHNTVFEFGKWTKTITDSIGGEWVDQQKENYENFVDYIKPKKFRTKWWKF